MKKKIQHTEFRVPKTYFESFEKNIMQKIDSNLQNDYSVPDNYFESFEKNILQKITTHKKIIPLKKVAFFTTIAASIILFISVILHPKNSLNFTDLSNSEMENYILENTDTYTLSTYIQEFPIQIETKSQLKSNEILDYLQETDIESLY